MRQRRWLKSFKGYELHIQYHSGRTQVIKIVLHTPTLSSVTNIITKQLSLSSEREYYSVPFMSFEQAHVSLSTLTFMFSCQRLSCMTLYSRKDSSEL